jgi:hypothetical protein
MGIPAIGIEHALDVTVQRPQDADPPGMHQEVAALAALIRQLSTALASRRLIWLSVYRT